MSDTPIDTRDGQPVDAGTLLARAAGAEVRAHRALVVAIDDFFLPEAARLDERTRAALASLVRALVGTVEGAIRDHAARLLHARGETDLAATLAQTGPVHPRLMRSGLLRDPELMAELVARVRQELIGAALPMHAPDNPERPSLVNRFVDDVDRAVSASAMDLLVAQSRRRGSARAPRSSTELPSELHHRLVWWVAAVLRAQAGAASEAFDLVLSEAAQRSLSGHDEGDRLEAAATRFAAAIDAQSGDRAALLVEALDDRRIVLFVALLGHALGIPYDLARDLVLDPAGDRLWIALRSLGLGREAIAQIGYALCEADPRRDLETFADTLDAAVAIDPAEAHAALAPLRLHRDYRAAVIALERAGGGE